MVGVGRSGTSLLQSMLASHPQVSFMPETSFFRSYLASGKLAKLYRIGGMDLVAEHLENDEKFARLGIRPKELLNGIDPDQKDLERAVYLQMTSISAHEKVSFVGDKDPRLIEFLPSLAKLFPDALVLHIIRDPRDILSSKKKAEWSRGRHSWKHIFANRIQLKLGRSHGPLLFGESYQEIIYEELISSPVDVLSALCKKLGVDFDESMLDFKKAAKRLASPEEISWKKETFGPLLQNNSGQWKSNLTHDEVQLAELCCSDSMQAGGYRKDDRVHKTSVLGKLWIFVGWACIVMLTQPYFIYRNLTIARACRKQAS